MAGLVPSVLLPRIQVHINRFCPKGEKGWGSGRKAEDVLTGDFCGNLRTTDWSNVASPTGKWRWRIDYYKFGSGGEDAEETLIGADGVFQIELDDRAAKRKKHKAFLFQAKKSTNPDYAMLLDQINKMEGLVKGAGVIFEYTPRGYFAIDVKSVRRARGKLADIPEASKTPLCEFLIKEFVGCNFGERGLRYEDDGDGLALYIPTGTAKFREIRGRLPHDLTIRVQRLGV